VGVDLERPPGAVTISIRGRSGAGRQWERRVTASVLAKEYPSEAFSVPPSFDQIDAATMRRIKREQAEFDRLWKTRTASRLWDGGFLAPVSGDITSPFGLRRVINSSPRAPHGGVDLKAQLGAEIAAANHGRVVLRDDFYFSGKSVVLDHGGGAYTMYFHLSEFRVEKNAAVRKGSVIGLAGMTGRVTGPHLHWGARLNGARVDPMELLKIEGGRQK
ncbi:MAG: M23 family metallopeptidase, partial [Candidatus Omnitrophota bacterium]